MNDDAHASQDGHPMQPPRIETASSVRCRLCILYTGCLIQGGVWVCIQTPLPVRVHRLPVRPQLCVYMTGLTGRDVCVQTPLPVPCTLYTVLQIFLARKECCVHRRKRHTPPPLEDTAHTPSVTLTGRGVCLTPLFLRHSTRVSDREERTHSTRNCPTINNPRCLCVWASFARTCQSESLCAAPICVRWS